MACRVLETMWYTVLVTTLVFLSKKMHVRSEPQVPCYFIFGDSFVDSGNNNALMTLAKANYPPYGIDFPHGPDRPTFGRFTNRRTTPDFIAESLGIPEYIPPYATARGREIIRGVNYGSGGAGIRDETGRNLGVVISLNRQLQNHETIISRITTLLGSKISAQNHLRKCLYHVEIGSNDYINNYFRPILFPTSQIYSLDEYAKVLIQQYSQQLKTLYNFGARKVAVSGLPQIGSAPAVMGNRSYINSASRPFNERLKLLVDDLNNKLPDAKFILINTTSISPGEVSAAGIKVVDAPCCKISPLTGLCWPGLIPCSNRTEYFFWDGFHLTESAIAIFASKAYKARSPSDAYPYDIKHLVRH